jgi:hypothetical protein
LADCVNPVDKPALRTGFLVPKHEPGYFSWIVRICARDPVDDVFLPSARFQPDLIGQAPQLRQLQANEGSLGNFMVTLDLSNEFLMGFDWTHRLLRDGDLVFQGAHRSLDEFFGIARRGLRSKHFASSGRRCAGLAPCFASGLGHCIRDTTQLCLEVLDPNDGLYVSGHDPSSTALM